MRALAERDIPLLGGNVLYLDGGTRSQFFAFLAREVPQRTDEYMRIDRETYAAPACAAQVRRVLRLVRDGYRMRAPSGAGQRQTDRRVEGA